MSKLNRRTIAVFAAVLLAAAATGLAWIYVSSVKTEAAQQEEVATVLVARETIPANTSGESIVENNLVERREVPTRFVAPGAVANEVDLKEKVLQADLSSGQQLVTGQLVQRGSEGVLDIPAGMRAFSISIDRQHAVAGLIRPGDLVDVIATFEFDTYNKSNIPVGPSLSRQEVERVKQEFGIDLSSIRSDVSRMLLQGTRVIHIDPVDDTVAEGADGDADNTRVPDSPAAVLVVSPFDLEKLTFAQEFGTISLALRGPEDGSVIETPGRTPANEFHRTPGEPEQQLPAETAVQQTTY